MKRIVRMSRIYEEERRIKTVFIYVKYIVFYFCLVFVFNVD